jgi:hypothetical protein
VITGILTATITPTHTITQTHTITPTFTITPTATNTPVELVMSDMGPYPNPSEKEVRIIFFLSRYADVNLTFYTVSGETVAEIGGTYPSGFNTVLWNNKNVSKQPVAAGVYLYSILAKTEKGEKVRSSGKLAIIR